MRIHAYIRVVGGETAIRTIHNEAKIQEAVIKETKASKDPTGGAKWWNWNAPSVPLEEDNADSGLKEMLLKHRSIFPIIKKQSGPDCVTYLQLVTEYEKDEEPRGLYLSGETIGLLSELGGAFDNDVVLTDGRAGGAP